MAAPFSVVVRNAADKVYSDAAVEGEWHWASSGEPGDWRMSTIGCNNTFSKFVLLMFGLLLLFGVAAAQSVASNVVAQRAGTTLVDLSYDLSGADTSGATVTVSVESSNLFGASTLESPSLIGDMGAGIANGGGKQIVWDAGADQADFPCIYSFPAFPVCGCSG